jgi:hypothetical protein
VAPPRILTNPQDLIALTGTTVSLQATADGSAPLRYQWLKNGTAVPGASSPTLTIPGVQFDHRGAYYLTVENDFGSAASTVAQLDVYAAPTLAALPDAFAQVLRRLVISNAVTDINVPPLNLVYSLAAGAPTNATINPTNGLFRWIPNRAQAPGTNLITVRVADRDRPLVSNTTSFTVYVNDYLELLPSSVTMLTGETNSVPLDVFSSADLLNLHFVLKYPENRLANAWLEPLIPETATASMQAAGANRATLTFTAMDGHTLKGTQHVARLHFTAAPGQSSAFLPLSFSAMDAQVRPAEVEPTLLLNDSRVVVLGTQPLLEARNKPGNQHEVTLYGKRGTNYVIEYTTNLVNGALWRPRGTIFGSSLTNLSQSTILNLPAPPVFYRARQQ